MKVTINYKKLLRKILKREPSPDELKIFSEGILVGIKEVLGNFKKVIKK
jgi:hypothetical protein